MDVGSVVYSYARQLRLPRGVPAHLSSTLASMGSALPYGIAAKLASPDRPVVALAGTRHAGRVGASLLHRVGLDELVADDPQTYITLAAGLAADPERLSMLRSGMRERLVASPLLDGDGFARSIEAAFAEIRLP